jgi:predicted small secreted protein
MGNFLKGIIMKSARSLLVVLVLASMLTACGTVGGAVSGAGSDLSRAGEWIKSR